MGPSTKTRRFYSPFDRCSGHRVLSQRSGSGSQIAIIPPRGVATSNVIPDIATTDTFHPRAGAALQACKHSAMPVQRHSILDENCGIRALEALLEGDLGGSADALDHACLRYLVGFFCRLGLIMPSVAIRLAVRTARRRLSSQGHGGDGAATPTRKGRLLEDHPVPVAVAHVPVRRA